MTWETRGGYGRRGPYHVIPVNDAIEHEEHAGCWCRPALEEDGRVLIHHSADGRELQEPDARYPPATRQ